MQPEASGEKEDKALDVRDPHGFKCLLSESSVHGVKYLGQKDRPVWERLVWLILILASTVGAANSVYRVMSQYYASPVIVSFQTAQTSISQIPYPAVTVCNINKFRKSGFLKTLQEVKSMHEDEAKAEAANDTETLESIKPKLLMRMKLLRAFESMCKGTNSFHVQFNYSLNETTPNLKDRGVDLEYGTKVHLRDALSPEFTELWNKYGQQACSEMIPLCLWEGEPFDCSSGFAQHYTPYGSCCTFNMIPEEFYFKDRPVVHASNLTTKEKLDWESFDIDKHIIIDEDNETESDREFPRRQSKAGQEWGLSFLLNPELEEYYCGGNSAFGFRVLAHPPMESPRVKDFGLAVGPGAEVFMDVQAELTLADDNIKDLYPATRYCYYSKEQPLNLFQIYSQSNCIDECISNLVLANCSCIRQDLPLPKVDMDLAFCEGESLACSDKLRAYILQLAGDNDDFNTTYCKDCFPSCNRIEYSVRTSTLPLREDPETWLDTNNNKASWADLNVSIVHVYFGSDSVYSRVRKKLYGTNDLIANIGGVLGLFLGMSIIGIVEPVFYIVKLIYLKISRPRDV